MQKETDEKPKKDDSILAYLASWLPNMPAASNISLPSISGFFGQRPRRQDIFFTIEPEEDTSPKPGQ